MSEDRRGKFFKKIEKREREKYLFFLLRWILEVDLIINNKKVETYYYFSKKNN